MSTTKGHVTQIYGFISTSTRPLTTLQHGRQDCTNLKLQLTMTSKFIGHERNIYGFISTSARHVTSKNCRMTDQHAPTLVCTWQWHYFSQVTRQTQLYFYFYKVYDNQNWQDGKPSCTDFTLYITMKLPAIGHVTDIYGFVTLPGI